MKTPDISWLAPERRFHRSRHDNVRYSASSSQSKSTPDDAPIPDMPRYGSPSSPDRHSAEILLSLGRTHTPARSPPLAESPRRDRSRSPTLRQTFPSVLGYQFNELESVRLISNVNRNRTFQLRTYIFPPRKPIALRNRNQVLLPMPTEEQIVISTYDGNVCAILKREANRHIGFRAIFTLDDLYSKRAKINIWSGVIKEMTEEEIAECTVGRWVAIRNNFKVIRV